MGASAASSALATTHGCRLRPRRLRMERRRLGGEGGASACATFSVGRGKSLGVEDLLRHVGQGSEKKPADRFHVEAMDHSPGGLACNENISKLLELDSAMAVSSAMNYKEE